MPEYKLSSSMYKRIQERKNRLCFWICTLAMIEVTIVLVCVLSGRDGIVLAVFLEGVFLYCVWRFFLIDIMAVLHKDTRGSIVEMKAERFIERRVVGGGRRGKGVAYGRRGIMKYTLTVLCENDKTRTVLLPTKDAYRSYMIGDRVLMVRFMPYPIITSRTPHIAVCPQCASILHYEDGACHECGLDDIYAGFCKTPIWDRD